MMGRRSLLWTRFWRAKLSADNTASGRLSAPHPLPLRRESALGFPKPHPLIPSPRRGEWERGRGKRIPWHPESAFSFLWRRTAPGDRKPEQQSTAHPSQPADPDQPDPRDRPRRSTARRADRRGSVGGGARARSRPGRGGTARATPGREDHGLREVQVRAGQGGAGGEEKAARHPSQGSEIPARDRRSRLDRKSTRLNSSHLVISYAVFCLKKKKCSPCLRCRPSTHKSSHSSC